MSYSSDDSEDYNEFNRKRRSNKSPLQDLIDGVVDIIHPCPSCFSSKNESTDDICDCKERSHYCDCQYGGSCVVAVIIMIVIGIIVVGVYYWLSKYTQSHDLNSNSGLGKILSTVPGAGAGFWELTHLILYAVLGFFFPTCDAIILSIGALWEFVEHYLSLNLKPIRRPKPNGGYDETQWWYGSAMDVVVDIIGFYIGKSFRLLMLPPNPKNCEDSECKDCDEYDDHICDGYTLPKFKEDDITLFHYR